MKLVLDASVAGKWLVPERDSEKARSVFRKWNDGEVELIAPALLTAEVASMLWKRAIRGLMAGGDAVSLFEEFSQFGLSLTPIEMLAPAALKLSVVHRHPVYDCLYVALALEANCELLTADEGLFRVFWPTMRTVRLLKDWSAEVS